MTKIEWNKQTKSARTTTTDSWIPLVVGMSGHHGTENTLPIRTKPVTWMDYPSDLGTTVMQILAYVSFCANHGCLRKCICAAPGFPHQPTPAACLPTRCSAPWVLLPPPSGQCLPHPWRYREGCLLCPPPISRCKLQWCPFEAPFTSSPFCLIDFHCLRSLLSTVW